MGEITIDELDMGNEGMTRLEDWAEARAVMLA